MMNRHFTTPQTIRDRFIDELRGKGIHDEKVLEAFRKVAREAFVSAAFKSDAYKNEALPIGESQTISQPLIVAMMTEALNVDYSSKVLEIGTGCGYQTAILCKLVRRVFTIERFESLGRSAEKRLHDMGINNFATRIGDGSLGWPEQAPFDRIIVTAASPKLPTSYIDQLAPGGILIIPVGPHYVGSIQKLMRYEKGMDGKLSETCLCDVKFVPLVGKEGLQDVRSA